jgi:hypothetical protein
MRLTFGLLALLGLGTISSTRAEEKGDFLKADDWEGLTQYWKVDGTTLVGSSGKEGLKFNTFLCSKKKYKNFELKFSVRLKDGVGNSGVQIRSKMHKIEEFAVAGPQCDIGAQYWGSLYGEHFGGMMKEAPRAKVEEKLKKNDFNEYHIKAIGNHVTISVNGVVSVDEKFDKLPEEGMIAFQLHAGPAMEVTFRDIEFKDLTTPKK